MTDRMPQENGHVKLLRQLVADGLTHMYGNPGSSEEGLADALRLVPEIQYVLTLQESVAVAMGDGHARATGKPALVQLHCGVGLGNGVGMLYQAKRGHTPLVVLAGEAGVTYSAFDAQMACDLVAIARPVTKYAARVEHPASLLRHLRRAIKMAVTPPQGPVFLAIPQDILDAVNTEPVFPTPVPDTRSVPSPDAIAQAAAILSGAEKPLILMGDGVVRSGAQAELIAVAECLGAEVWGVDNSETNIPSDHPLYCGSTGHMFGPVSRAIVADADAVLVVGTFLFPEVFPDLQSPFSVGCKIVHIDLDSYEIAKNHPVDIGLVADPKASLAALAERLGPPPDKARARFSAIAKRNAEALLAQRAKDAARSTLKVRLCDFVRELSARLPADAIVFDEALTNSPELTRWLPPTKPGTFFQTRGGSLGIGFPGALGAKTAFPNRTVVGFSGDGGCMYTIQALWTAAHHHIGAKMVSLNDGGYRLLKYNLEEYWQVGGIDPHEFPWFFDISAPRVDTVALAKAMGVPGMTVDRPEAIAPAITAMLETEGPFVVDLLLDTDV